MALIIASLGGVGATAFGYFDPGQFSQGKKSTYPSADQTPPQVSRLDERNAPDHVDDLKEISWTLFEGGMSMIPLWLQLDYGASNVTYHPLLVLPTYPPKKTVTFSIDGTFYTKNIFIRPLLNSSESD